MQRKKETRPESLQAKGRATQKSTTSLSQLEWERKWNEEMGPAVIVMAIFLFAFRALGEAGVIS